MSCSGIKFVADSDGVAVTKHKFFQKNRRVYDRQISRQNTVTKLDGLERIFVAAAHSVDFIFDQNTLPEANGGVPLGGFGGGDDYFFTKNTVTTEAIRENLAQNGIAWKSHTSANILHDLAAVFGTNRQIGRQNAVTKLDGLESVFVAAARGVDFIFDQNALPKANGGVPLGGFGGGDDYFFTKNTVTTEAIRESLTKRGVAWKSHTSANILHDLAAVFGTNRQIGRQNAVTKLDGLKRIFVAAARSVDFIFD